DAVVFIYDVGDAHAGDRAGVEGLAAGGGIERCAVEVDGATVVRALDDPCVEVAEVGVRVVETVGHVRIIALNCARHDWPASHAGGRCGARACLRPHRHDL